MIGAVFLALAPIALLIGSGHAMRRFKFLPDNFWPHAERLSYFVLLPSLFVHGLATADLSDVPFAELAVALILSILIVAALLLLCGRFLKLEGAVLTSVFQGGIRFNNYVGITAAVALFGAPAVGLAAVANATIVPTVNILSILVFARYGAAPAAFLRVVRSVVTNPLVLGCAIGGAFQATGLGLPPGVDTALRALGQAALPLGLLSVGAALEWSALGTGLRATLLASAGKFVAMPLVTVVVCLSFGLSGDIAMIAVLFQSLPTASSSYVLARQLGGDAALMAGIIAFQTLLALLTLPIALLIGQSIFL